MLSRLVMAVDKSIVHATVLISLRRNLSYL